MLQFSDKQLIAAFYTEPYMHGAVYFKAGHSYTAQCGLSVGGSIIWRQEELSMPRQLKSHPHGGLASREHGQNMLDHFWANKNA